MNSSSFRFERATRGFKGGNWLFKKLRRAVGGVETGCLRVTPDAPRLLSALVGVVLSSDLRAFIYFQTVSGFSCMDVAF